MAQLNLFQGGEDLPLFNQPDEGPEVFASGFCVDDLDEGPAYPLGQCEVCGWGVDRLTLCRQCADEQIAELDESYRARGITWEVYTQGVNICLERSGRLPR